MENENNNNNKIKVYHERQRLQMCLLHTLNNLFQQEEAFTRSSLNLIAQKLVSEDPDELQSTWTPWSMVSKPHHNVLTGNYDVNVLISALEERGKAVVWHDRRNGGASIDLDSDDNDEGLFGMVLNVQVRRLVGLWKGRHWVALRRIGGVWYNLDSDFREPLSFRDSEEVREFLDCVISQGGEVFLVMNKKD